MIDDIVIGAWLRDINIHIYNSVEPIFFHRSEVSPGSTAPLLGDQLRSEMDDH